MRYWDASALVPIFIEEASTRKLSVAGEPPILASRPG